VEVLDEAGGVGTPDVVAFEQDLSAAAGAHELVTELIEARGGCACAEHGERGGEDYSDL
jgi:hypothetical protein